MVAAAERGINVRPVQGNVDNGAAPVTVAEAQRVLRFLGFYKGRTDGEYESVKEAILAFQNAHGLAGGWESPGEGLIGPLTGERLRGEWNRILVERLADDWGDYQDIGEHIVDEGLVMDQFLEEGHYGDQVRALQRLLTMKGFFAEEEINGSFGPMTAGAVAEYQVANDLVRSETSHGAGRVGPSTLRHMKKSMQKEYYARLREKGWRGL